MRETVDIQTLFSEAILKSSPEECQKFLDSACGGDAQLRSEVLALIDSHYNAGKFLGGITHGASQPTVVHPVTERPGTTIGRYTLHNQIGEGGFGVVYRAEQTKPVKREVALKIIKPGMDTKEVINRFAAEQQALALMNHPHIARVIDAGATDAGRPFFVMDLVEGVPITDYCDQQKLSTDDRLRLFLQVCDAVQHAHQKGIIHRDLKPSNIMVTLHNGRPVPKVIDFGVAKAISQRLTEQTIYTSAVQMIGTPMYMSPEQAEPGAIDVDTRSDVYSLGVLLYELLTGTTPFDRERFKSATYDEIRRVIREEDPPRPSARISTLGAGASTLAEQRKTDTRRLTVGLKNELDWIVMKALEKDRERRYESVTALAADVEHYLGGEPVQACPPSAWYRAKKYARRNRGTLITGAVVVVALLAGTGVSVWQAIEATKARKLANERYQREQHARTDADRDRRRAEQNLIEARRAVDKMLTRISDGFLNQIPGMAPVRKSILDDALVFYQTILNENSDDADTVWRNADAMHRSGRILWDLNQADEAVRLAQEGIHILQKLVSDYPAIARYRGTLAEAHHLASAVLVTSLGDEKQSNEHLTTAVDLALQLNADETDDLETRQMVLQIKMDITGTSIWRHEHRDATEILLKQSREIAERLVVDFPEDLGCRAELVRVHSRTGNFLIRKGNRHDAELFLRKTVSMTEKITRDFPHDVRVARMLPDSLLALAGFLKHENASEAQELLVRAKAQLDLEKEKFPNAIETRESQAMLLFEWADTAAKLNRPIEAASFYQRAMRERFESLNIWPNPYGFGQAFEAYDRACSVLAQLGKMGEILPLSREAADGFQLLNELTQNASYAGSFTCRAKIFFRLGAYDNAVADLTTAIELNHDNLQMLEAISPSDIAACQDEQFRSGLVRLAARAIELSSADRKSNAYVARATIHTALQNWDEARADLAAAARDDSASLDVRHRHALLCLKDSQNQTGYREICRKMLALVANEPNAADLNTAVWICVLAPDAVDDPQQLVRLAERACEIQPQSPAYEDTLAWALCRAGQFDASVQRFMDVVQQMKGSAYATTYFGLAMAEYQAGRRSIAKAWLTRGVRRATASRNSDLGWTEQTELDLFQREAEALIGPVPRSPALPEPPVNTEGEKPIVVR